MAKLPKISKKDKKILKELKDNPAGLRVNTLQKLTDIKERTVYNHLSNLKKHNLIENIFPIWRLCQNQISVSELANLLKSDKKIQSHKFSFHLKLIRKPDWWDKRENRLIKLKEYNFKINKKVDWGNNPYEQLIKNNFLIHTFPNAIYFINQKKYYNDDSYLAFQEALEDTLELLRFLEERFKFKFFLDNVPQLSVRTNHFVKLNDEIANKCKKERYMLQVPINGKLRVWVDMSQPFGLEAGNKNHGVEDMKRYRDVVEDYISKESLLPSQLTDVVKQTAIQISQVTQNQMDFGNQMMFLRDNLKTHFEVLKGIKDGIKKLTRVVGGIQKENKRLRLGKQTTLGGWI